MIMYSHGIIGNGDSDHVNSNNYNLKNIYLIKLIKLRYFIISRRLFYR